MAPKKFYAVKRGRKPGIYFNWADAKAEIDGFQGAVYKGFVSLKDAEEWLNSAAFNTSQTKNSHTPRLDSNTDGITIYTDGGSLGNPGPGGYGAVIIYNNEKKEISGGFRVTTNNRMELMGVIAALRELDPKDKPVTIYSDSSYVVNGINKGWAKSWEKNNWIKSNKEPAINPDLWSELLKLVKPLNVSFVWVKGHSGNPLNERCDELAKSSASKSNLPVDKGYKHKK
ncbi:MAG: ribonuclease HI [Spirochaetota bacterium]